MSCIFCDVVNRSIKAKIIDENELSLAFMDINPVSDGHILVISKKHYRCFSETPPETLASMASLCYKVANKISNSKLKPLGFNYLCNEGEIAGQIIFHVHIHIIPKYKKDEGFKPSAVKRHNLNSSLDEIYQMIMDSK